MPTESDLLPDLPHPPGPAPLRDRLAGWAESLDLSLSRLVIGAVVTVVLGLAGWRLLAPSDAPPEMELPMSTGGDEVPAAAVSEAPPDLGSEQAGEQDAADEPADVRGSVPTPPAEGGEVVVHVAGAVQAPGVQRMDLSARVVDAVEASGGPTGDADLARINMAAELQDGQQIYVPAVGEDPPPPVVTGETGTAGTSSASSTGNASGGGAADIVNINSASVEELEALPGVGPAIGQAIVDHRESNGPFSSVDQLTDVRGIGEAKLEGLRDQATV